MIEIRNISHRYTGRQAGEHWALRNVSLSIAHGTFVSLLGPSGCGKTTLLRIANGLVRPSQGEVFIDGGRVTGPSADRAMVFQEFNLLPWRTARRNVEMPLEVLGIAAKLRQEISARRLAQVGLAKFAGFYPHQLSGGMKQRVGLARALAIDPSYLFMDEPFGALDPQIREMMQIELMKLWDVEGPTGRPEADKRDGLSHLLPIGEKGGMRGPADGARSNGMPPSPHPSPLRGEGARGRATGQTSPRKTVLFVTHSVDEAVFLSDRVILLGTSPGRVIADLAIDLPRPRWIDDEALKRSSAFIAYRNDIWHMLKQQLVQSPDNPTAASGA